MERIAMSPEERDWLEWLKRAQDGLITQRQAAEKMDVTDRWVRRLLAHMAEVGDQVVVHGLRGRVPAPNPLPARSNATGGTGLRLAARAPGGNLEQPAGSGIGKGIQIGRASCRERVECSVSGSS